jgi:hypothetical protein
MELHPRSLSLSLSGTAAVRHDRRASVGGDVDGGSSVCSVGSNTSLRIVEHRFRAYPLVKKNPTRHPMGTRPGSWLPGVGSEKRINHLSYHLHCINTHFCT